MPVWRPTLALASLLAAGCGEGRVGGRLRSTEDAAVNPAADARQVAAEDALGGGEDRSAPASDAASIPTPDARVTIDSGGGTIDAGVLDSAVRDSGPPRDSGVTMGPSSGCGQARSGGVFQQNIMVNGTQRSYVLAVPSGYDPSRPYQLIFGWHGNSWLGTSFRASIDIEQQAQGAAIVLYPDGLAPPGGQTTWDLDHNGGDMQFFDTLVGFMLNSYCVDQDRIFSFGRSRGAYFTNELACARGNLFRGIAAMSGSGPFGSCSSTPVAAWLSHSDDDPTVPISGGRASRDYYLGVDGCLSDSTPMNPSPCVTYQCNDKPVAWCELATGGHSPPSFAGSAIWAFFSSL